eukprot:GHUV01031394.1.p1 GENE.GHUV01031394.1~~GHUV01031394.1.p1  ORF type:complete len:313 (+),score=57.36 GHUV01031394.1:290-1228(+)
MAAASHLAHPCPGQYRQCAGPGLSCLVQLSSTIGNRQLAVAPMALARSLQPAAAGSLAPPSRIQKQDSQLARQRKGHSRGNTTEPAQQQRRTQKQQAISQQQQPVWGYLTGTDTDTWTWDDDYNPGVRARAAAEAQHLPPTPRQQALAQREAAAAQQRPRVITRLPEHFSSKVLANGVLLLDKPPRWSSADVVRQLNTVLKVQKIGVGGPLDVQATGLLIVLFGEFAFCKASMLAATQPYLQYKLDCGRLASFELPNPHGLDVCGTQSFHDSPMAASKAAASKSPLLLHLTTQHQPVIAIPPIFEAGSSHSQ